MCGEAPAVDLVHFAQKRRLAIGANRSHAPRLTSGLRGAAPCRGTAVAFWPLVSRPCITHV